MNSGTTKKEIPTFLRVVVEIFSDIRLGSYLNALGKKKNIFLAHCKRYYRINQIHFEIIKLSTSSGRINSSVLKSAMGFEENFWSTIFQETSRYLDSSHHLLNRAHLQIERARVDRAGVILPPLGGDVGPVLQKVINKEL